jgi:hypothetical protein
MNPDDASKATVAMNSPPLGREVSRDAPVMTPINGRINTVIAPIWGPTAREGMLTLADQIVASATNFVTGVISGRACRILSTQNRRPRQHRRSMVYQTFVHRRLLGRPERNEIRPAQIPTANRPTHVRAT